MQKNVILCLLAPLKVRAKKSYFYFCQEIVFLTLGAFLCLLAPLKVRGKQSPLYIFFTRNSLSQMIFLFFVCRKALYSIFDDEQKKYVHVVTVSLYLIMSMKYCGTLCSRMVRRQ